MDTSIPKELLESEYRKKMWEKTEKILSRLEKTLPITSAYLLGSFTTEKSRPADVDFILLLNTEEKEPESEWSVDIVISPDNEFGNATLQDAKKWMKQKYGTKKSAVIKLK